MTMNDLILNKSFIICMGSGGVGKTTLAASLGVLGAHLGKKTLIVTIDPAKRLANALGLRSLLTHPKEVSKATLQASGIELNAPLFAMMLDMGAAWDDLVKRLVSKEEAKVIFDNRFYTYLSRELAGSQEFVACETLYQLAEQGTYDLIVLDTPPTVHAIDFLEAPKRITSFLGQEAFQYFLSQRSRMGRMSFKFLGGAGFVAQTLLERLTGATFIREITEFVFALQNIYPSMVERVGKFQDLLSSEKTAFLTVLQPRPSSLREAKNIAAELEERSLPFEGFIANGVLPLVEPAVLPSLEGVEEPLKRAVETAALEQKQVAEKERELLDGLDAWIIPRQMEDIHDASGLARLLPYLTKAASP